MAHQSETLFDLEIADASRGWLPYLHRMPAGNLLYLEIWRREWPGPRIVYQPELPSWLNVHGLYWREV